MTTRFGLVVGILAALLAVSASTALAQQLEADELALVDALVATIEKHGSYPEIRVQAGDVAAEIGARAVPRLLELLDEGELETKLAVGYLIGRIGPPAADAVPSLLDSVASRSELQAVADSIAAIGPDAIAPALEVYHERPESRAGYAAGYGVARMAVDVRTIGPKIDLLSEEPAEELRRALLESIAEARSDDRIVIDALIAATTQSLPGLRSAAVAALGRCRPIDAVVPALLTILRDEEDHSRRRSAFYRLVGLGTDALPVLQADSLDPTHRANAALVVAEIDPPASVPMLLAALDDADTDIAKEFIAALTKVGDHAAAATEPLFARLAQPDIRDDEVAAIIRFLGTIAPRSDELQAAIAQGFDRKYFWDAWNAATWAVRYAADPVPFLPELLHWLESDPLSTTERLALESLVVFGPDARPAVPHLLSWARSRDSENRALAFTALAAIGVTTDEFDALLDAALLAKRPELARPLVVALGAEAGPLVVARAQADDVDTVLAGIDWLGALADPYPEGGAVIAERLLDDDRDVRRAALRAIRAFPETAAEVPDWTYLANLSCGWEWRLEYASVGALAALGAKGDALLAVAVAQDYNAADEAYVELTSGNHDPAIVVPIIAAGIPKSAVHTRQRKLDMLVETWPDAPATGTALAGLLGAADIDVQSAAASALVRLGPPGAVATPALVALLESGHPASRIVLAALRAIGPAAVSATPTVVARLADDNLKYDVVDTMASIGAAGAPEAIDALVAALSNEAPAVRTLAASCLSKIGPPAESAIPALITTLADPHQSTRDVGLMALVAIGEARPEVIDAIARALDPENQVWLRNLARALRAFGTAADAATDALRACLPSAWRSVADAIISALVTISSDPLAQLPAIFARADADKRYEYIEPLVRLGADVFPYLVERVASGEPYVWVSRTLIALGQDPVATLDALRPWIEHDEKWVRGETITSVLGLPLDTPGLLALLAERLTSEPEQSTRTTILHSLSVAEAIADSPDSQLVRAVLAAWLRDLPPEWHDKPWLGQEREYVRAYIGVSDLSDPDSAAVLLERLAANAPWEAQLNIIQALQEAGNQTQAYRDALVARATAEHGGTNARYADRIRSAARCAAARFTPDVDVWRLWLAELDYQRFERRGAVYDATIATPPPLDLALPQLHVALAAAESVDAVRNALNVLRAVYGIPD